MFIKMMNSASKVTMKTESFPFRQIATKNVQVFVMGVVYNTVTKSTFINGKNICIFVFSEYICKGYGLKSAVCMHIQLCFHR